MRTMNSIKNIISNLMNNVLLNILRFVSRIIFVKQIGELYLGVNGLLSNVLGLLALSELGIGTAINYSLYKPLADKDEKKVKSLMQFYQKTYRYISLFIFVMGIILMFFLPYLIKDTEGIENLSLIYLIFLMNMVIGYLFSYKRTLIIADQKNYKIMPIIMLFNFLTTVLQIIVLLIFKNYIIYLLVQSICILLENIFVNRYINKEYPYIKNLKDSVSIEKQELKNIQTNVKALMYHKIGTYAVSSTDNLIISKFIGIVSVGIYSNYCLLLNTVSSVIYLFINNVISSFGNLIVEEKPEKRLQVFNEMYFIYFVLYAISTVCFMNLLNPFIEIAFGEKFLLDLPTVYLISFNFYLAGMMNVLDLVKSAAGIYDKDKFVPLVQAFVNIVFSIILAIQIGLIGVFIGTLLSSLVPLIIKPFIIYKDIFETNVKGYFKEFGCHFILLVISILLSMVILYFIPISNGILNIVIRLLISVLVPGIILFICYRKSKEFQSFLNRGKFILNRRKNG